MDALKVAGVVGVGAVLAGTAGMLSDIMGGDPAEETAERVLKRFDTDRSGSIDVAIEATYHEWIDCKVPNGNGRVSIPELRDVDDAITSSNDCLQG